MHVCIRGLPPLRVICVMLYGLWLACRYAVCNVVEATVWFSRCLLEVRSIRPYLHGTSCLPCAIAAVQDSVGCVELVSA